MIKLISSVKNPLKIKPAALKTEGTEQEFLLEGDKFINDTASEDIVRIFSTDTDICRRIDNTVEEV